MMEHVERSGQEEFIWAMRTRALAYIESETQIWQERKLSTSTLGLGTTEFEEVDDESCNKLLSSLLCDYVLYNPNNFKPKRFESCLLYGTIDGYDELYELYNNNTKGSHSRLSQILNQYIGSIIQDILFFNGDILNICGNKIIAVWKSGDETNWSMQDCVQNAIDCGLSITKVHPVFNTQIGVQLKVKIVITGGVLSFSLIGDGENALFVVVGGALTESQFEEYRVCNGEVYVSQSGWLHVDAVEYYFTSTDNHGVKVHNMSPQWRSRVKTKLVSVNNKSLTNESDDIEKDIFQLRPSVRYAVASNLKKDIIKFMIPPILKTLAMNETFEYLTDMRHIVTMVVRITSDAKTDRILISVIDQCASLIRDIVTPIDGYILKVVYTGTEILFTVLYGMRGAKHNLNSEKPLKCAASCYKWLKPIDYVNSLSIAVTSGNSYVGMLGHYLRREFSVISMSYLRAHNLVHLYHDKVVCDRDSFLISRLDPGHFLLQYHKSADGIIDMGSVYQFQETEYAHTQLTKAIKMHPILGRDKEMQLYQDVLEKRKEFFRLEMLLQEETDRMNEILAAEKEARKNARLERRRLREEKRLKREEELLNDPEGANAEEEVEEEVEEEEESDLEVYDATERIEELAVDITYVLVFCGRPRIGKTRLTEEILYTTPKDIPIFRIKEEFKDKRVKVPYLTVELIFSVPLGLTDASTMEERELKLHAKLKDISVPELMCALNIVFKVNFPVTIEYIELTDEEKFQSRVKLIIHLCFKCFVRRFIIMIDDADYADTESWPIIDAIMRTRQIFFVVTVTKIIPGDYISREFVGQPHCIVEYLAPLEKEHFAALACQLMHVHAIPPELERVMHMKSCGNPGWIENFLINLQQSHEINVLLIPVDQIGNYGLIAPAPHLLQRDKKRYARGRSNSRSLLSRSFEVQTTNPELFDLFDRWKIFRDIFRGSGTDLSAVIKTHEPTSANIKPINKQGQPRKKSILLFKLNTEEGKKKSDMIDVCVMAPGADIEDVNPEVSFEVVILKIFDSLSSYEQLVMKVGSVIGDSFPRDMLLYVLDMRKHFRKNAQAIQKLFEIGVLGCAQGDFMLGTNNAVLPPPKIDVAKEHLVYCNCLGLKVPDVCENLPSYSNCGYLRFKIKHFKDMTYNMLTTIQKRDYHIKAIQYLEHRTKRCRKCGSGYFAKIMGQRFEGTTENIQGKKRKIFAPDGKGMYRSSTSLIEKWDQIQDRRNRTMKTKSSSMSAIALKFSLTLASHERDFDSSVSISSRGALKTVKRLKDQDALLRSFSKTTFVDCECYRIQDSMYRQLYDHTQAAEVWDKWLQVVLEYSLLCIEIANIPWALNMLALAIMHIEENSLLFVTSEELWKVPFIKAKLYSIMGKAKLEQGQLKEAHDKLELALKLFGYQFPSPFSLKVKLMEFQNFLAIYCFSSFGVGSRDGYNAEHCDNIAECLSTLCSIFMIRGKLINAEIAAIWSLKKALQSDKEFPTLISAFSNLISVSIMQRRTKLLLPLEVKSLLYCRRYKATIEVKDLKAIFHLYSNIFVARMFRGEIDRSLLMGETIVKIAKSLNAEVLALSILPMYIQLLLITNRTLDAVAVILEFEYICLDFSDHTGETWFYALCLGFQLDTGYVILPFSQCENIYYLKRKSKSANEPAATKRYFTVVWLWYLRSEMYEDACLWEVHAKRVFLLRVADSMANIYTAMYYLEALILNTIMQLDRKHVFSMEKTYAEIDNVIRLLELNERHVRLITPRLMHLKAFYKMAKHDEAEPFNLLNKARKYAVNMGNIYDELWINHSEMAWQKDMSPVELTFWKDHCDADMLDYHELENNEGKLGFYTFEAPTYKIGV